MRFGLRWEVTGSGYPHEARLFSGIGHPICGPAVCLRRGDPKLCCRTADRVQLESNALRRHRLGMFSKAFLATCFGASKIERGNFNPRFRSSLSNGF
jgi:hypothetical protein